MSSSSSTESSSTPPSSSSESNASSAWSESDKDSWDDENSWDGSTWSISSEEIEAKRDYEFGKRRLPRDFPFTEEWSPKKKRKFFKLIGMTKETFLDLLEEVINYLPIGASTNGQSLTPLERMLYFLKFFRKCEIADNAAYSNDMSEGAVIENISIVIEALNPRAGPNFCKRHIFLPDTQKGQCEALQFMEMSGFPPLVIGAADGFHVQVRNVSHFFDDSCNHIHTRCTGKF